MAHEIHSHPAGEPEKESLSKLLGSATALQRIFKADPALVNLIISNQGFLETLFSQPVSFRAFLQTNPGEDDLDQLFAGMGGDGAALAGSSRPHEVRLAGLLRDPQEAAALFRGQPNLAETLLGNPVLAEQVKVRRPELYKALLDKAQERFGGDSEMARLIASERAGIITFTAEGGISETPERRAIRENGMTLLEAVKNGDTDLARLLIEKGADLNAKDEWRRTSLHWAAIDGDTDLAWLLIEKGADPTSKDLWQVTPLHFAADNSHTDLARLLIEKGADLTAEDDRQVTPLHWAAKKGDKDLARLLIEKGADPTAKDDWKWTPLHWAVKKGDKDLARLLIEKGADPTAKDTWQRTPLHWAAENGRTDLVTMLQDAAKAQPGHAGRVAMRRDSDEMQVGG